MWNETVNIQFCESRHHANFPFTGITEFGNSISSVFIIIYGILGLHLFTKKREPFASLLFSLLIVNGIGSIFFHATLTKGWSFIDSFPMLIITSLGCAYLATLCHKNIIVSMGLSIAFTFWCILAMVLEATGSHQNVFLFLFTAPFVYIFYITYSIGKLYGGVIQQSAVIGMVWCSIGGLLWAIEHHFCNGLIGYLHLHVFWHYIMPHGSYHIIFVLGYFNLQQRLQASTPFIMYSPWTKSNIASLN